MPVPILAGPNMGRISAPFRPHRVQVNLGSMSDNRTSSSQPSALASVWWLQRWSRQLVLDPGCAGDLQTAQKPGERGARSGPLKLRSRRWLRFQSATRRDAGFTPADSPESGVRIESTWRTVRGVDAAARASIRQPDVVGPAVGVGFDVMAAAMIAAIDQDLAHAGCAHLAEGDFGGVVSRSSLDQTRRYLLRLSLEQLLSL